MRPRNLVLSLPLVRSLSLPSFFLPPTPRYRLPLYRPPQEVQRPGAPYKKFEHAVIYHPKSQTWEIEGEALDSAGNARIQYSAPQSLAMGMRR